MFHAARVPCWSILFIRSHLSVTTFVSQNNAMYNNITLCQCIQFWLLAKLITSNLSNFNFQCELLVI